MKTISNLLFALRILLLSDTERAAAHARRRLDHNNDLIADAERHLAAAKTQRTENARTDAAALKDVIATAKGDAASAETRRQAEIDEANTLLDRRIASLEAAIQRAKDANAELLEDLADKHEADREDEQDRLEDAQDALDELNAAAGNDSK